MSRETDEALDQAVTNACRAEGWDGVITGWMVLVGVATTTSEGGSASGIQIIYRDGELPWPMSLGLVNGARRIVERSFMDTE